jgi:hypothetical protein
MVTEKADLEQSKTGLAKIFAEQKPLLLLLFLGTIGCFFYLYQSEKVFPSASIDLKVPQSQILLLANTWKDKCHYDEPEKSGVIHSTIFAFDDDAKTFLEYELGQSAANALMRDEIPIWYWSTRYCKPLKQEEFTCWLNPEGELVSFDHTIESDAELPTIDHEKALEMSKAALISDIHLNLDDYKLIEDGTIKQVHRTDHYFTWEHTRQSYKGAKLRAYAYVSGNELSQINNYLHIPEAWKRKYTKLRSYNEALEGVATIFYTALTTGVFFVFLWAFANGYIRWRFALIVGLLYSAFAIADAVNSLPSSLHEYTTTTPWDGFVMEFVLGALWSGVSTFFQIFCLTAAVEALYRVTRPSKLSIEKSFTLKGLQTKQSLETMLAGLGAFGIHMGWLVAYYLLGRAFGLWCPLEVQNVETLSSTVPAFSAINVGFIACLTEELTYRVLGLTVFQRLVKNFWLANILQAAAWAFMHSNYPQEPPYARGLELTVVGIIYGAVLKRYGIVACMLSHNMIDSFLGLQPLFVANVTSLKLSAYAAFAPFVAIIVTPIILWLRNWKFVSAHDLLNAQFVVSKEGSIVEEAKHAPRCHLYRPLPNITRIILAVIIVVAGCVEFGLYAKTIGSRFNVIMTREQALKKATEVLEARDLRPDNYSSVAWLGSGIDTEQFQYVFEKAPDRVISLSQSPETPLIWHVRFYKPNSGNEYAVSFDAYGHLIKTDIELEEDEAGASLNKAAARKLVEDYLKKLHPELLPFSMENCVQTQRDKRVDWTFTFKVPKFKVGEADYKVTVRCIGDQPSGYSNEWSLPSKWTFQRNIKSWRERITQYVPWILSLIVVAYGLFWARGVVRASAIAWRAAIFMGLFAACITFASIINALPTCFSSYATESPLLIFFVSEGVSYFVKAMSQFSIFTLTAAFGIGALRLLLPSPTIASIFKTMLTPSRGQEMTSNRQLWLDAALIGYAVGIGWQAISIFISFMRCTISPEVPIAALNSTAYFTNFFDPAIGLTLDALLYSVEFFFGMAICVGLYAKYIRSFRVYLLLSLAFSLLFPLSEKYWQEYLLASIGYFSSCLIVYVLVAKLAKENLAAYFLVGATASLVSSLRLLIAHGRTQYLQDVITTTVIVLIPLGYVLYASLNTASREKGIPETADGGTTEVSNLDDSADLDSLETET